MLFFQSSIFDLQSSILNPLSSILHPPPLPAILDFQHSSLQSGPPPILLRWILVLIAGHFVVDRVA
jgi:hypothetical protein